MHDETHGLGYTAFEVGESFGSKKPKQDDKSPSKVNKKNLDKKAYKLVCSICHKVGHTANICRNRPSTHTCSISHELVHTARVCRNKPNMFNGHCYDCNKFGHKANECRIRLNNQRTFVNQESPYQNENRWNVTCSHCHNHGHMAINCRLRTNISNIGPQRSTGMVCFHCNKIVHIARFCTLKNKGKLLGIKKTTKKGKQIDMVEETKKQMRKVLIKKDENKSWKGYASPSGAEVSSAN